MYDPKLMKETCIATAAGMTIEQFRSLPVSEQHKMIRQAWKKSVRSLIAQSEQREFPEDDKTEYELNQLQGEQQ